jgi:hypothetical protein
VNSPNPSLIERVAASVKQLSLVSADLNQASNELGQAVSAIDAVLQTLNLGISTWFRYYSGTDGSGDYYYNRDIGYAKHGNKWGVCLRSTSGYYPSPEDEECEIWLFNDAPRWLRIEAVERIPDLLEALIQDTHEAARNVREKTSEANQLATAIAQAVGEKLPNPKSMAAKARDALKTPSPEGK